MSTAAPARQAGRGRPPTGARERILEAGLEVLKAEGYGGFTVAKVAAASGENKALIGYHFGSKAGLIAEAARTLGDLITSEVLDGLEGAGRVEDIVRGTLDSTWRLLDEDERLARAYFDLSAVSVVSDDVREVMRGVKGRWRQVIGALLRDASDGPPPRAAGAATVLVMAGVEGLCLERIERGVTPDLGRACDLFVAATAKAIASAPTPAPASPG